MLYHLLYPLKTVFGGFNVFRYLTFRSIYAILTALIIAFILGPWVIRQLRRHQIGQYIREDGPASHLCKAGTPTMGGILIIAATIGSTLLWADLSNTYVWLLIFVTLSFGGIGFLDDYLKVIKKHNRGLSGRGKLVSQIIVAAVVAVWLYSLPGFETTLTLPFFKELNPDLGWGFLPLAVFVIVGAANAVNLTDGLDGLAIGPVTIAAAFFMILAYLSGNIKIADYLQISYVRGVGELAIFCGALVGSGIGFLWYNSYPAEVFMGDVGALALGGILGTIAIAIKQEILLAIVGGIFVVEALSVILQVSFFKVTNGRRIFRMAPIHHHFELKGWAEPKVIVRFWILAIILGLLALSTLKLR
ncbi:phospho-N-acetylmuramoyl-pentapeptide-transferase [Desulfobacca acetoxidans]|uniref:Phospho-N-acetylmuramoyl-pentapeptide-transferase n=1 Tax=Desulfobacca acetoxidans (strain ATCC 700848 / DSM 11109 / ASRB2) TaxID=880072 RepID=F2NG73_DESAR|nr:phospho-N-acetylmuramoyl-pentapeptide-transferase [Desulfobacca acetoxidans]AEB08486.1 Phospho-N-acetylmuramoyl-pentapeptide-transferase [Desulfobacca acetoxidans DSM 11109]